MGGDLAPCAEDDPDRSARSPTRWVRSGTGDGTPLVALHTWHTEAEGYGALAGAMGDRPTYSLLPPVPGADPMPRRVEQWVDFHDAALAALPLSPPFRLVGWSFGGVVAVELARRLRARGTDVDFVGMIDTTRPKLRPLGSREFVWYHLGESLDLPEAARLRYLRSKGFVLATRRFPRLASVRRVAGSAGPRPPAEHEKPTDPLVVSVHTAYLHYRGDAVDFPVSLYTTAESVERSGSPALRWARWLEGGYELVPIAGEHHTVFDPAHVDDLAAALRTSLAGVGGGRAAPDPQPLPGRMR